MSVRIATVNVNGVRAAFRKGMSEWLDDRGVDILALQEVRASTEDLEELLGPDWNILHDAATAKGRAGVALVSRSSAEIHRVSLGSDEFDTAGRWLEADYKIGDKILTVVSTYVHSGEVDTPKQVEKFAERYMLASDRIGDVEFVSRAAMLERACVVLEEMVGLLRKGMALETTKELNDKLQAIEAEADRLILELYRDTYTNETDPMRYLILKDLFEILEKAIDRCRDAGNVIYGVVLKNA